MASVTAKTLRRTAPHASPHLKNEVGRGNGAETVMGGLTFTAQIGRDRHGLPYVTLGKGTYGSTSALEKVSEVEAVFGLDPIRGKADTSEAIIEIENPKSCTLVIKDPDLKEAMDRLRRGDPTLTRIYEANSPGHSFAPVDGHGVGDRAAMFWLYLTQLPQITEYINDLVNTITQLFYPDGRDDEQTGVLQEHRQLLGARGGQAAQPTNININTHFGIGRNTATTIANLLIAHLRGALQRAGINATFTGFAYGPNAFATDFPGQGGLPAFVKGAGFVMEHEALALSLADFLGYRGRVHDTIYISDVPLAVDDDGEIIPPDPAGAGTAMGQSARRMALVHLFQQTGKLRDFEREVEGRHPEEERRAFGAIGASGIGLDKVHAVEAAELTACHGIAAAAAAHSDDHDPAPNEAIQDGNALGARYPSDYFKGILGEARDIVGGNIAKYDFTGASPHDVRAAVNQRKNVSDTYRGLVRPIITRIVRGQQYEMTLRQVALWTAAGRAYPPRLTATATWTEGQRGNAIAERGGAETRATTAGLQAASASRRLRRNPTIDQLAEVGGHLNTYHDETFDAAVYAVLADELGPFTEQISRLASVAAEARRQATPAVAVLAEMLAALPPSSLDALDLGGTEDDPALWRALAAGIVVDPAEIAACETTDAVIALLRAHVRPLIAARIAEIDSLQKAMEIKLRHADPAITPLQIRQAIDERFKKVLIAPAEKMTDGANLIFDDYAAQTKHYFLGINQEELPEADGAVEPVVIPGGIVPAHILMVGYVRVQLGAALGDITWLERALNYGLAQPRAMFVLPLDRGFVDQYR